MEESHKKSRTRPKSRTDSYTADPDSNRWDAMKSNIEESYARSKAKRSDPYIADPVSKRWDSMKANMEESFTKSKTFPKSRADSYVADPNSNRWDAMMSGMEESYTKTKLGKLKKLPPKENNMKLLQPHLF